MPDVSVQVSSLAALKLTKMSSNITTMLGSERQIGSDRKVEV